MPVSPAPAEAAPAKVSLRQKHADATRQRILDEAMTLFLAQGFEATTVEEIADRADVSPRTFFRYFATKDALLFSDFETRMEKLQTLIDQRPEGEAPLDTLVAVIGELVDEIDDDPDQRALAQRLLAERPSLRSYQRSAIAEHSEGQITESLARRAGLAPDDLGLRALTAAAAGWIDLALKEWLSLDPPEPFGPTFRRTIDACAALMRPVQP
jgi:AcrR family transcriptional regulator